MTLNFGYLGVVHLLQTKLERVVSPLNLKGGLEKHPNYFLGSYSVHHSINGLYANAIIFLFFIHFSILTSKDQI